MHLNHTLRIAILLALALNASAQKTFILIQSQPGVEVKLDTAFKGITSPGKGELRIENVMPASYLLRFVSNGDSMLHSLVVEDKNERILYVDLKNKQVEDRSPVNRASKYEMLTYKNPGIWYEVFTDPRDEQQYRSIRIGNQTWMAENLNYTMRGKSFVYPRDSLHVYIYGKLYTWKDAIKACPPGWHLPDDEEWCMLEKELGIADSVSLSRGWRQNEQRSSLKASAGWLASNNAKDNLGFAAFPGGFRDNEGYFFNEGYFAYFWTSTETTANEAWYRVLIHDLDHVGRFSYDKDYSFSIRCIKDD